MKYFYRGCVFFLLGCTYGQILTNNQQAKRIQQLESRFEVHIMQTDTVAFKLGRLNKK